MFLVVAAAFATGLVIDAFALGAGVSLGTFAAIVVGGLLLRDRLI